MPVYLNPNPHPVVISLSAPRISMTVFPARWAASRVPNGGRQFIELDACLAREVVRIGMLQAAPAPAAAPTEELPPPEPAPSVPSVVEAADPEPAPASPPQSDIETVPITKVKAAKKPRAARFFVPPEE